MPSPSKKSQITIHVQGHAADPVHGVIGFNSSTGDTTKPNNILGVVKEAFNSVLGKETTAHNCYGVGTDRCKNQGLLNDGLLKWEPVYKPKISSTTNTAGNQETLKESDK